MENTRIDSITQIVSSYINYEHYKQYKAMLSNDLAILIKEDFEKSLWNIEQQIELPPAIEEILCFSLAQVNWEYIANMV